MVVEGVFNLLDNQKFCLFLITCLIRSFFQPQFINIKDSAVDVSRCSSSLVSLAAVQLFTFSEPILRRSSSACRLLLLQTPPPADSSS